MRTSPRVVLVGLTVLGGDQLSKLAATSLAPSGSSDTPTWSAGILSIVPVGTGGVIGDIGVERPDLVPALAVLALMLLLALSRRLTAGSTLGAALALAGATGNLIDRVRVGYVIDFLAVDLGPAQVILNLADVALFIGLPLLVLAARSADGHASSRIGHPKGLQT
ncbi:MAG: signal peptidase II [Geodermatophilaceae bacterium]|nr:signal peptidase II [Geodermatophilaceae bacterium]